MCGSETRIAGSILSNGDHSSKHNSRDGRNSVIQSMPYHVNPLALDELHLHKRARLRTMRSVGRNSFVDFENGNDLRTMKLSGNRCLAVKPGSIVSGSQWCRWKHRYSLRPVELCVFGLIDHAHAASADFRDDFVVG